MYGESEITVTWHPVIFSFLSSWTWTALQPSCISQRRESQRELIHLTCKESDLLQNSWLSGLRTAQTFRYYIQKYSHSNIQICKRRTVAHMYHCGTILHFFRQLYNVRQYHKVCLDTTDSAEGLKATLATTYITHLYLCLKFCHSCCILVNVGIKFGFFKTANRPTKF